MKRNTNPKIESPDYQTRIGNNKLDKSYLRIYNKMDNFKAKLNNKRDNYPLINILLSRFSF